MVVPNVLWAFSQYQRRFGVDLRMAAAIAGSALITAYPTARFTTGLDPCVLRLAFAVFSPPLPVRSPIGRGAVVLGLGEGAGVLGAG